MWKAWTNVPLARPTGVGETPLVVNPAYNIREEVLALRAALELTDDELDTQLEIGKLWKHIVLLTLAHFASSRVSIASTSDNFSFQKYGRKKRTS